MHFALTPNTLQDSTQELTRSIAELRIHCDYQRQGCLVVVSFGELQTHVDAECEYNANPPTYNPGLRRPSVIRRRIAPLPKRFSSTEPERQVSDYLSLEAEPPPKGMAVATEAEE